MPENSTERFVMTGFSGLAGASWLYCAAALLDASLPVAVACSLFGAALVGGVMWLRYRNGYRSEVETADEAGLPMRLAVTAGMGAVGGFAGFMFADAIAPRLAWWICVAVAITPALAVARLAWRHPALFYKNRSL